MEKVSVEAKGNLMRKTLFLLIILILSQHLFGQWPFKKDYKMAREIWSEPVAVEPFINSNLAFDAPTLNVTLDTMYLDGGTAGITRAILINGQWTEVVSTPNLPVGAEHPSLSRDGKRIYYSRWGGYGNWDMYLSNWNDTQKIWGTPENLGPVINSPSIEWYAHEVSKDTLYLIGDVISTLGKVRYIKDSTSAEWIEDETYEYDAGNMSGLSVTTNRKKMYFSQWLSTWEDHYKKGTELCVTYWDSAKGDWGENYFLNINAETTKLDTSEYPEIIGGYDANPWISADGKVLFFASTRNVNWKDTVASPDIYVSYLLVDENGDTVTTIKNDSPRTYNFTLHQNYPNPFNPTTTISYSLEKSGFVKLNVYDLLGREVGNLINKEQAMGNYKVEFNASSLTSGVYFYRLQSGDFVEAKKLILLR